MNFRRNLSHLLSGFCLLLIFNTQAFGQEKDIDPVAVSILDKMSDVIGEIESCRFVLLKDEDHINQDGMVERTRSLGGNMQIRGTPNKGTTVTVNVPLIKTGDA